MNPRRILIVTERFYPEDFVINRLALHWRQRGHEVTVLTQQPSYPQGIVYKDYKNSIYSKQQWQGITVNRFFTVTGYRDSLARKLLNYASFAFTGCTAALLTLKKYDRVFIYQTGPLTLALPGILVKLLTGARTAIWTQDVWPDTVYAYGFKKTLPLKLFLNALVGFIYRNCHEILISCPGFAQKIAPYHHAATPVIYAPNWAMTDCSAGTHEAQKLSAKTNFMFAGNIGKLQNLENVILGFGRFIAQGGSGTLHILGDGSNLPALKTLARDMPDIVFHGRKPLEEMPSWLTAADVLVISLVKSPIFELTVPSKFQAYLTAGKPLFAVMEGEVAYLTQKYEVGITAPPQDIAAIADGFKKLAALSPQQTALMKNRALELFKTQFTAETVISRIDKALGL